MKNSNKKIYAKVEKKEKWPANKSVFALILFLIFYFTVASVPADAVEKSIFSGAGGIYSPANLHGLENLPACEKSLFFNAKTKLKPTSVFLQMVAGIVGNVALGIAGGYAGSAISSFAHQGEYSGFILGIHAGSTLGSALGVYLAGSVGNGDKSGFGSALLGSSLANLAAFAIAVIALSDESQGSAYGYVVSLAVLPPIGATIFYNSSRRKRSLSAGTALLNLNKDKLMFGIPDLQIRPLPAYGENMKVEFQFKINMLSVAF
jgi:hypothetical protein